MSLFLGKIHYWLYNKILWQEKTEEEIILWARAKELPVNHWVKQEIEQYGQSTEKKALDEIIDSANIHGWLQDRIKSAELRQADLITTILAENKEYEEDLTAIFVKQGKMAAQSYTEESKTPEEVFKAINDFVLEGMPCDNVSKVISSSKDEIIWENSVCLHEPYWKQVKGDVKNFHKFRDVWVSSFIEELNPEFSYKRTESEAYSITRK